MNAFNTFNGNPNIFLRDVGSSARSRFWARPRKCGTLLLACQHYKGFIIICLGSMIELSCVTRGLAVRNPITFQPADWTVSCVQMYTTIMYKIWSLQPGTVAHLPAICRSEPADQISMTWLRQLHWVFCLLLRVVKNIKAEIWCLELSGIKCLACHDLGKKKRNHKKFTVITRWYTAGERLPYYDKLNLQ